MEKEYFDNGQRVETGIIDRIPLEILTYLFLYLRLKDRKNCRRVCHQWLKASSDKRFQRKEKLVWKRRCIDFGDFSRIMRKNWREIWNFEFRDTKFDNSKQSQKFWRLYGKRIESLSFKDCFLTQKMLKSVIIYCHNLREISFDDTRLTCWKRSHFCGLGPKMRLDELMIRSGIRRESLTTFRIRTYANDRQFSLTNAVGKGVLCPPRTFLTDEFFRCVRFIYPKIKEFIIDSVYAMKIIDFKSHEYLLQRRIKSTNHVSEEYIPARKAKFYYPELVVDFDFRCMLQNPENSSNFLHYLLTR